MVLWRVYALHTPRGRVYRGCPRYAAAFLNATRQRVDLQFFDDEILIFGALIHVVPIG